MINDIVFSGSLRFLSLADVFQLLGGNNCNGILTLRSPYTADMGFVYFVNGSLVNAAWGELRGMEAVYALFGWMDGTYEFAEQDLVGIEPVIKQGMMEIVMGAVRLLDDGKLTRLGHDTTPPIDPDTTAAGDDDPQYVYPIKGPLVDYRYVTIENHYPDGATIVKEGKPGKWLWVISEGTVRIVKETPKGDITLARLGEGCFIGTIGSFLYGEYERSATAIAEGDVQLCILDIEVLHREFSSLSQDFRCVLLTLDKRLRIVNENAVAAFSGSYRKPLPPDKVMKDAYQSSADLFIIREGTADIIGKGPAGDVKLLSLGRDDVFGKIPFMAFGHEPVYAAVMTSKNFQAERLDSQALQKEYEKLSHTFRNFVFSSATNIAMTTKLFYQFLGTGRSDEGPGV